MTTLVDHSGKISVLGGSLGRGGEGEVFELIGGREVAKVYFASSRVRDRRDKLSVMIAAPPNDPTRHLGHTSLCWPSRLLFDKGRHFVGFAMPRVDARFLTLSRFINPKLFPRQLSWDLQLVVAANLSGVVSAVHRAGYVIGDLNRRNIFVDTRCMVTLVDCDSIQVRDGRSRRLFPCPVGMAELTAPEFQGAVFEHVERTPASDVFALSILVSQLLLGGAHPYTIGGQAIVDSIQHGSSFIAGRSALPPGVVDLELLPPVVRRLLIQCFGVGHRDPAQRPTASQMARALNQARQRIRTCPNGISSHRFSDHSKSCPWCLHSRSWGVSIYGYQGSGRISRWTRAPVLRQQGVTLPNSPSTTSLSMVLLLSSLRPLLDAWLRFFVAWAISLPRLMTAGAVFVLAFALVGLLVFGLAGNRDRRPVGTQSKPSLPVVSPDYYTPPIRGREAPISTQEVPPQEIPVPDWDSSVQVETKPDLYSDQGRVERSEKVGRSSLAGGRRHPRTALVWRSSDNGSDITWHEAIAYCKALPGDWRLPTLSELMGLSERSANGEQNVWSGVRLSSCCPWSSQVAGTGEAWAFVFSTGERYALPSAVGDGTRALCVHN